MVRPLAVRSRPSSPFADRPGRARTGAQAAAVPAITGRAPSRSGFRERNPDRPGRSGVTHDRPDGIPRRGVELGDKMGSLEPWHPDRHPRRGRLHARQPGGNPTLGPGTDAGPAGQGPRAHGARAAQSLVDPGEACRSARRPMGQDAHGMTPYRGLPDPPVHGPADWSAAAERMRSHVPAPGPRVRSPTASERAAILDHLQRQGGG